MEVRVGPLVFGFPVREIVSGRGLRVFFCATQPAQTKTFRVAQERFRVRGGFLGRVGLGRGPRVSAHRFEDARLGLALLDRLELGQLFVVHVAEVVLVLTRLLGLFEHVWLLFAEEGLELGRRLRFLFCAVFLGFL